MRATGARTRLGFDRARCKEASWLFTNRRIPANPRPGVTVEQYLEFADALECPPGPPEWQLPYEPFAAPAQGERRVVVNVGASKPANRWQIESWARLCERLSTEWDARTEPGTGTSTGAASSTSAGTDRPSSHTD